MDFVFGNTPVTWFDVNAINGISSRSILQTWTNANRNGYEFTITDIFRSTSGFNSDMVFYQAEELLVLQRFNPASVDEFVWQSLKALLSDTLLSARRDAVSSLCLDMRNLIISVLMLNLFSGGRFDLDAAQTSTPAAASAVMPLWPDGPAESKGLHETELIKQRGTPNAPDQAVNNITEPDIEIFRAAQPNGTGVLIIPGGGYHYETIDKEGRDIARWFNSIGVNAFVLKYRLPNTTTHRFGPEVPLRDAQRALRLVRSHAAEWNVRPDRIGAIGFSAGGHLASTLGTHFDAGDASAAAPVDRASCRPDFLMLGYPVISMEAAITHTGSRNELLGKNPSPELVQRFSNELHVTTNTPPVFIFCASDDHAVKTDNSLDFYNAARKAGVPAELHIFEKGGHGFGMNPNNRAGTSWPPLCESWLRERGLLGAQKSGSSK